MTNIPDTLKRAIQSVFKDCLRLKTTESLLILADAPMQNLAASFHQCVTHFNQQSIFLVLPALKSVNNEPSQSIARLLKEVDVAILLTSNSLSHTTARRTACKSGTRIVSMPNVTEEILTRTMTSDYKEMMRRSRRIADILTIGHSVTIQTDAGTDLSFSIIRKKGKTDTGMIHEKGLFSNLPAGEACIGPVEGSANGKLVVDLSFARVGLLENPVKFTIRDGYVQRIAGNSEAESIRHLLRPYGTPGRLIAELGIGTNPHAKVTGCTLEDEKSIGTAHIALGNNLSFEGKNDVKCHFDGVFKDPTIWIDNKLILKKGEPLV